MGSFGSCRYSVVGREGGGGVGYEPMTLSIYGSASLFIYMKLSSSTTGDLGLNRRVRLLETALVDRRVYAFARLYFDLTTGSPSEIQLAVRKNRRNARCKYMNPGKRLGMEHCTLP